MGKVRIRNKRTGRDKVVLERAAHHFVQAGRWEYVGAEVTPEPQSPPKPAPKPETVDEGANLEDLSYNDLRRLASQMGLNPEGRKAEDYIAAIEEARDGEVVVQEEREDAHSYGTRALNAED